MSSNSPYSNPLRKPFDLRYQKTPAATAMHPINIPIHTPELDDFAGVTRAAALPCPTSLVPHVGAGTWPRPGLKATGFCVGFGCGGSAVLTGGWRQSAPGGQLVRGAGSGGGFGSAPVIATGWRVGIAMMPCGGGLVLIAGAGAPAKLGIDGSFGLVGTQALGANVMTACPSTEHTCLMAVLVKLPTSEIAFEHTLSRWQPRLNTLKEVQQ